MPIHRSSEQQASTNLESRPKLIRGKQPFEGSLSSAWRLPSGKSLAEFALRSGFLAPSLLGAEKPALGSMSLGR